MKLSDLLRVSMLLFATACGEDGSSDDDNDDDGLGGGFGTTMSSTSGGSSGGSTGSGSSGGSTGGTTGDAPTIVDADAWCYQHKTGEKFYQWALNATVSDPQGADTIPGLLSDAVTVLFNGSAVASYPITCSDDGDCFGSFNETDDGIACQSASSYTIQFVIVDEDDNASEPYEVEGREGSSAAG